MVFFGVRSFRERTGGAVTFGRALLVGVAITLVSMLCYIAAFELMFAHLGRHPEEEIIMISINRQSDPARPASAEP